MADSFWYERVWRLPLTFDQQLGAVHLLLELQLSEEELELLVPHDKELAVANIKAEFAKCRCRMRNAVGGSCNCTLQGFNHVQVHCEHMYVMYAHRQSEDC